MSGRKVGVDQRRSGIASLAAAVVMIRDAGVAPGDICIYEESDDIGGAMAMHGARR